MDPLGKQALLDADGKPLSARIQEVLRDMLPRLQSRIPALGNDLLVTEVLEEAGRRIAAQEAKGGPVSNLPAYAWRTVLNVLRSRLRRAPMRLERATLGSEASDAVLRTLTTSVGTPAQIEADILVQQVLAQLTDEEQALCTLKRLGFSSREIARALGISVANVNTQFYRLKRRIRDVLAGSHVDETMTDSTPERPKADAQGVTRPQRKRR
jgi:RNA polymerase sigma factor (sigma-70 family)